MKTFSLNARTVERKFMREVTKRGYFRTVNGNLNHVVDYNRTSLVVKTASKGGVFEIKRIKIRKAASFVFFKRSVIREELAPYSNFTSALFAIIQSLFRDISRVQILKYGMFRMILKGIRFLPSGAERDPFLIKLISDLGGKFILLNYYNLGGSMKFLDTLEKYDLYAVIDSGSFSFYQNKMKQNKGKRKQIELFSETVTDELTLEGYASFINKVKDNDRILGCFPFDVVGDPVKTKEYYSKLKSLTDGKIFPVWQCTDSLDELEKLVNEEHELIGIGGIVPFLSNRKNIVRDILDKVFSRFPTVPFHFLGGANEMLCEYPWFSSDSTAYINARKSRKQRKVYLNNGYRVDAPASMSTVDIIKQNLEYLLGLEDCMNSIQLSMGWEESICV